MERITDISQLKAGDKIVSINGFDGRPKILEFVCIHPHNPEYSVFLNETYDGAPKFYNKRIQEEKWFRYDSDAWNEIHQMEIAWHKKRIKDLEERS